MRDAGMEVVYLGLRLTPAQIADAAIQEDVDVVGLSCLSGAHLTLFPATVERVRAGGGSGIVMLAGGVIPEKDIPRLKAAGITEVFGPGTPLEDIVNCIRTNVGDRAQTGDAGRR